MAGAKIKRNRDCRLWSYFLGSAVNDADFRREYRKVVGDDASPMTPEELTNAIQDTPRDAELIEWFKTFSGAAPLPAR